MASRAGAGTARLRRREGAFIVSIARNAARRGFTPPAAAALLSNPAEAAPASRRWLLQPRTVGGAAVALLALAVVARQARGLDWSLVWSRLIAADGRLLVAAALVFWLTALARTLRWRCLLASAGVTPPPLPALLEMYVRGWFANSVAIAQLGDLHRADLLRRATGISRATTLGAIVAERLLDLAVLGAMLAGAALLAFHGQLPPGVLAGGVAVALGALGVGGAIVTLGQRRLIVRLAPAQLRAASVSLLEGYRRSLAALPAAAAFSASAWLLEAATLALVAHAVGAPMGPVAAVAAALTGALLTAVPVLPAGLGLTEAGLVVILLRLGVAADSAAAIALLARGITYWSVVAVGAALTLARHRARGVDHVV
jgi:glycosyltransferase 2 family protein